MAGVDPIVTLEHRHGDDWWRFSRRAAPAAFCPHVVSNVDYAETTRSFNVRRELPHPAPVLIVNLGEPIGIVDGFGIRHVFGAGEGFIAGLHERFALSESGGSQAGVQVALSPLGAIRLLGVPLGRLAGEVAGLAAVLGSVVARELGARLVEAADTEARFALLERFVGDRLGRARDADSAVEWAWTQLTADPLQSVGALALATGISQRHFIARFREQVGLPPKAFAQVVRFDRLIKRVEGGALDWTTRALDAGYFDQPHMLRDFRRYAGMTPRAWLAATLPGGGGLAER
ncbi:helix-turn-helix domain-containing protein [Sphingosinicellaceae bacterium]|nr:helix-turn-helix domain-containing protein [Sphingosinicellaceae bacterium]